MDLDPDRQKHINNGSDNAQNSSNPSQSDGTKVEHGPPKPDKKETEVKGTNDAQSNHTDNTTNRQNDCVRLELEQGVPLPVSKKYVGKILHFKFIDEKDPTCPVWAPIHHFPDDHVVLTMQHRIPYETSSGRVSKPCT